MPAFITAIGTAVPPHHHSQKMIGDFMLKHLGLPKDKKQLVQVLYRASGIQKRHSVIKDFGNTFQDFSFFPQTENLEPFPSISQRMAVYEKEAIKLSLEAIQDGLSSKQINSVTHLVTVSCTGMYAPGIDIEIIEKLGLDTTIQRTAVNFMGCYASFNAIKLANHIIRSEPDANVLIVAVELCSIHLLKQSDPDSLLSNALFGDGAAALLVAGDPGPGINLEMSAFFSDLAPEGREFMSWRIGDFGFKMQLSPEVPQVIKEGIGKLTERLLSNLKLAVADIDYFAIHPGGKRILQVIEESLQLQPQDNIHAYTILKNYGNMSSPTVLFVLKQLIQSLDGSADHGKSILSFAFGPGLTLESMLLKVHSHV